MRNIPTNLKNLVTLTFVRTKGKREKRLTGLIRRERKRLYRRSLQDQISGWFRDIYYPSFSSLMIIGTALLTAHLLIRWDACDALNDESAQVARLQPIGVGVALIFVPIIVFTIGLSSRRTPSGVSAAEVLLRETYLFPIAILVIGLVANFIWVATTSAAVAVILLTSFLAVFTLYRLVRVLLDDHLQYLSGVRILQDKIRRSIILAVQERIGKNLLLKALEKLPLEYSPFGLGDDPGRTFYVRHPKQGTVQDVLLEKLATFANQLEEKANENGYAFAEKRVLKSVPGSILGPINKVDEKTLRVLKQRYLVTLYGDPIVGRRAQIAIFPRQLVANEGERERLAQIANEAIIVKEKESYSERVERSLADIKDGAIQAIRDRRTGSLGDLLEVYVRLAEAFLEEMTKLGGGHSFGMARKETQSLRESWNEVRWIREQLYEIHYQGCRSEDIFVARKVVSIPNRIAYAAIRSKDHLVFSEFTSFASSLYMASQAVKEEGLRNFLLDRTWRYLRELGDYGVDWELNRSDEDPAGLETIGDFGTTILLRYQDLLKKALERKSVSDFDTFMRAAWELFGHFNMLYQAGSEVASLTIELSRSKLTDEDRRHIERRIERSKALQKIRDKLDLQKRQMLFGIGSHILEKALEKPNEEVFTTLKQHVEGVVGQNLVELTSLYIETQKPEVRDLWGWEWWSEIPEGGGYVADPSARLTPYYCYLLLKSCQGLSDEQITGTPLPRARELVFEIGPQGTVAATLNNFASDRQKWAHLIPEAWLDKIPPLQRLFAGLIRDQKQTEEDRIIGSDLSQKRVAEFRNGFLREFVKNAAVRNILGRFSALKDETRLHLQTQAPPKWGLNTLDDKAAYLEGAGDLYHDWGENYARQLASSESLFAFDEILKKLPICNIPEEQPVDAKLLSAMQTLSHRGAKPKLVLLALSATQWINLERSDRYVPAWRLVRSPWKEIVGFDGVLLFDGGEVPVFRIWTGVDRNVACVMDAAKCLKWIQKSPLNSETEIEFLHGSFYFRVADLSKDHALRLQIQNENPPWLQQHEDRDRYLSQRVLLQIFERFEIELLDPEAGCKLTVEPQ